MLEKARTLVDRGECQKAATIIEDALPSSSPGDRGVMLSLLRQTYRKLISQAEAAGKSREADEYRDNLAIIDEPVNQRKGLSLRPDPPATQAEPAADSPLPAPPAKPDPVTAARPTAAPPPMRPSPKPIFEHCPARLRCPIKRSSQSRPPCPIPERCLRSTVQLRQNQRLLLRDRDPTRQRACHPARSRADRERRSVQAGPSAARTRSAPAPAQAEGVRRRAESG